MHNNNDGPSSSSNSTMACCFHKISTNDSDKNLQLLFLLLQCAELMVSTNTSPSDCHDLVLRLSQISSPFGSPSERLVAYFCDALRSLFISSSSSFLRLNTDDLLMTRRTMRLAENRRIYQAFQCYNSVSPMVKFSHFTANQAIFEAVEGDDTIHILDLDIMQGLQWPGLFHILASRSSNVKVKSLTITGFGSSMELLEATGRTLSDFATAVGINFRFYPLEAKIGDIEQVEKVMMGREYQEREGEATVVHWMQHSLYDVIGDHEGAVRILKELHPKIITIVEQQRHQQDINVTTCEDKGLGFMSRFVEALHYFSALFDALEGGDDSNDDGGSSERHVVERQVFGCEIRNIVFSQLEDQKKENSSNDNNRKKKKRVRRFGETFCKEGFRQVSLAGSPAAQASLLLGMYPWKGYTLVEEDGRLTLGWKRFPLLIASAWQWSSETEKMLLSGERCGGAR